MMRNPISDSQAIAAMPGLEALAEVLVEERPKQRKGRSDPLSQVIFAAVSRAFGSQEQAHSALRFGGLWDSLVVSAARVGRKLPPVPPTADQIGHLLRSGPNGLDPASLTVPMERVLNQIAMDLARQMGLFDPLVPLRWDPPLREHHISGDGTVAKPYSEVTEDNRMQRSRAADPASGARVCESYYGKPKEEDEEDNRPMGLPFVVASTHMGRQYGRVVLGLQVYMDGNEIGASMDVFGRVLPLAGGGIHTVHYDRLMSPKHILELARCGVVPIVEMRRAADGHKQALTVAPDDETFMRGRGRTRETKGRVAAVELGAFHHKKPGTNQDCWAHRLWSIDGQLRATSRKQHAPTLDAVPLLLLSVERRRLADRYAIEATYRLPCDRCGGVDITVDMAQNPRGLQRDVKALRNVAADRVRVINEQDPWFWEVAGRRSDSESTISTIKRMMPLFGRASRLNPGAYLWDLIGAALLINAQAWDVHVAQHTPAGLYIYTRQQAAELKAAA